MLFLNLAELTSTILSTAFFVIDLPTSADKSPNHSQMLRRPFSDIADRDFAEDTQCMLGPLCPRYHIVSKGE